MLKGGAFLVMRIMGVKWGSFIKGVRLGSFLMMGVRLENFLGSENMDVR